MTDPPPPSPGSVPQEENARLGQAHSARFMVACNLPQNDAHWASAAPEWVGTASMSKRHRFLLVRDLGWHWFNVLVFGLARGGGRTELGAAIEMLEAMRDAVRSYYA